MKQHHKRMGCMYTAFPYASVAPYAHVAICMCYHMHVLPYACVAICMCCHMHVLPYTCVAIMHVLPSCMCCHMHVNAIHV